MSISVTILRIPDALYLLILMWVIQGTQTLLGFEFGSYGIMPRTLDGLWHILLAPFIHHGIWHLLGNSIPFLLLGWLIQSKERVLFWEVTLLLTIVGGLGTWGFGSSGYHAGASGVVFGYWAYLLADAYYSRSAKNILLATVTACLYGGLIISLLDFRPHISWVGHASGMVAGILVAKLANGVKAKSV
ncbi:rhomboid family intramembrane serine protease [Candidatus Vondammii sp. HM_W22]|uniref:rhomboid family intramembrane serine protease n=1 Tax=Candidatus Vondammii sp. HM_W22 TaxID=2687299 RepID=UPI001F1459C9|nr:rhomboid family intramembrane serine protease [Candidatus Vondammii sp. HM_W22]